MPEKARGSRFMQGSMLSSHPACLPCALCRVSRCAISICLPPCGLSSAACLLQELTREFIVGLTGAHWLLQNLNGNFVVWRWLVFVGSLVPLYWLGEGVTKALVWVIETVFFFQKKALYFLVGTKVRCTPYCR